MKMTRDRPAAWRRYAVVLTYPLLVVALIAALTVCAVTVLGSVRAYVAGESQWSKARGQAVQHLLLYSQSHRNSDMVHFHEALKVPESDRLAREAMERGDPDTARIQQLLIDGKNHPDDVANMVRLFRWFGDAWLLKEPMVTWKQGDALIAQLNEQATLLQQAILTQAPAEQVDAILLRIDSIDTDLAAAGTHFGMVLAQAARLLDRLFIGCIVSIAALLTVVSVLQIRRVLIKQARDEYTMAQAHRRWELASAAAGLGLYEMDQASGTLRLDSKSAEMHGLGHAPLVLPRSALHDLIIHEDGERRQQDIDAALQTGAHHKMIYRVKHPDGTIRALESTGRMVQPQDGGAPCLIGVLRDVTQELSQADMALKRASAERVAQSQREFLSRLSHELRTPLNAILGFAQLLDMDQRQPLAQVQRQQVQWILSAGRQLLSLVEDVLDLSKVEAGEITMRLQPVDVHLAIQDCLHLVEGARLQHQIDILDQTEETPRLHVLADPQRLRQIIINLLSNACKYNHPGGHVTIEMHQDNDEVVININDSGLGMTTDDAADLFQPFKRAQGTMAYAEGTGLGLYIVKQLVERMNGSVSVASEPGVGSRFTVTLPAASDPL